MTTRDQATIDAIAGVAARVAGRYARRVWWADREELEQEAWLAALQAARTFDPSRGVPLAAYAWRAAVLAVGRYLLRQSAPVSAPYHKVGELAGILRARLTDFRPNEFEDGPRPALGRRELSVPATQEAVAAEASWHREVARALDRVLARLRDGDAAREVILGERRPQDVAAERGLRRKSVYKAVDRAKRAIGADARAYRLAREGH